MNQRFDARPRHTTRVPGNRPRHYYVRPIAAGTVQCGTCRAWVKARYLNRAAVCRDCDKTIRHEQWNHSAARRVAARLDGLDRNGRLHPSGGPA